MPQYTKATKVTKTDNLNRSKGTQQSDKILGPRNTAFLHILRLHSYLQFKNSVFVTFVIFVYCGVLLRLFLSFAARSGADRGANRTSMRPDNRGIVSLSP